MCQENQHLLRCAVFEYSQKLLSGLPDCEHLNDVVLSQRFEKRMNRLIKNQQRFYYPIINTTLKKVACFVVVGVAIISTVTACSKSTRKFFTSFIVQAKTDYASQIYIKEDTSNAPQTIVLNLPKYIPDGFELVSQYVRDIDKRAQSVYKNADGSAFFRIMQYIKDNESFSPAGSFELIKEIKLGKYKAIYIDYTEYRNIILVTEDYKYTIKGDISKDELVKIAESLI